jgi:hypothetical protein
MVTPPLAFIEPEELLAKVPELQVAERLPEAVTAPLMIIPSAELIAATVPDVVPPQFWLVDT